MSLGLNINQRNAVLKSMAARIQKERNSILVANQMDMEAYHGADIAMRDRLLVDHHKIDGMIQSLQKLVESPDPLGIERFQFTHENGMQISNKTAPFGTIHFIYETTPDFTF